MLAACKILGIPSISLTSSFKLRSGRPPGTAAILHRYTASEQQRDYRVGTERLRQRAAPRGMLKRLWSSLAKKASSDADAAPDYKKQKQTVFSFSVTVVAPKDLSPVPLKMNAQHESKRAVRQAKENATGKEMYDWDDYDKLVEPFEAAVASMYAKEGRPVTFTKVISEMMNMTKCEPKGTKQSKERFLGRGFEEDRWVISRTRGDGIFVAYPKGPLTRNPNSQNKFRFSPSPVPPPAGGSV